MPILTKNGCIVDYYGPDGRRTYAATTNAAAIALIHRLALRDAPEAWNEKVQSIVYRNSGTFPPTAYEFALLHHGVLDITVNDGVHIYGE